MSQASDVSTPVQVVELDDGTPVQVNSLGVGYLLALVGKSTSIVAGFQNGNAIDAIANEGEEVIHEVCHVATGIDEVTLAAQSPVVLLDILATTLKATLPDPDRAVKTFEKLISVFTADTETTPGGAGSE